MKQSSIEWLISFIEPSLTPEQKHFFSMVIERAKAMHKEEIVSTWHNGYDNQSPMIDEDNCGEHYYNETFNTKEK